jgi:tRNA-dihydrouridine synthase A
MLDVSTREFRYLMRLLTRSAVLWTEMVVDETLAHCRDPDAHLTLRDYDHHDGDRPRDDDRGGAAAAPRGCPSLLSASPVVCQIGGNRPRYAAAAARLARAHGYDGVDLNCECPSRRVASSREFGAALMKKPGVAAEVVAAMKEALSSPSPGSAAGADGGGAPPGQRKMWLSVKMRIGVDDDDGWEYLSGFVRGLAAHCRRFVVHARKVYTEGLNPDQNRRVPPLDYAAVYRLCREFPDCEFILNGGIRTLRQARALLFGTDALRKESEREDLDPADCSGDDDEERGGGRSGSPTAPLRRPPDNLRGVMMGRAARDDPVQFWEADRWFARAARSPDDPESGESDPGDGSEGAQGAAAAHPRVRNRRELLEAYCGYLERVYPRRCCDDDGRVTTQFPPPAVVRAAPHCARCRPLSAGATTKYEDEEKEAAYRDVPSSAACNPPAEALHQEAEKGGDGTGAAAEALRGRRWRKLQQRAQQQQREQRAADTAAAGPTRGAAAAPATTAAVKVSSNVIDRSFRPVWGVLHGQPGSRRFRKALFDAGRDLTIRNCGPARILRDVVVSSIPEEVLDRPFELTQGC